MDQGWSGWIGSEDQRWREALHDLPHDIYHTPEYIALAAKHEGGEAAAFLWRDAGRPYLIPLVLRPMPPALGAPAGWRDAFSPYGYPSPLAPPDATPEQVAGFLRAFATAATERGVVSAFIRLHPLLPLPADALAFAGTLVHHGSTVYADLRETEQQMLLKMNQNWRRGLKKLEREGFRARWDEWDDYAAFMATYRETMVRVHASASYRFSDDYFADLRARLGDHVHLCSVLAASGDLAAAGLFFTAGEIVQYHLGGTSGRYLRHSPTKLLLQATGRWARDRGHRFFHLGGGLGGAADSLYEFKAGYAAHQASFCTLRMVLNSERHEWLLQRAGVRQADPAARFPIYRSAPLYAAAQAR